MKHLYSLLFKRPIPFATLLAFIATVPFCVRFTRTSAAFMIYITWSYCVSFLLSFTPTGSFVLAKSHSVPLLVAFSRAVDSCLF